MEKIDTSKPVRFVDLDKRDWEVEFLVHLGGAEPLLFRYRRPGVPEWSVYRTDLQGHDAWRHPYIENIPTRHGRWVNFYPYLGGAYATREGADRHAAHNRIACVYVEFDEGEGL